MIPRVIIIISFFLLLSNINTSSLDAKDNAHTSEKHDRLHIQRIDIYGLSLLDRETFLSVFGLNEGVISLDQIDNGIKRTFRMGLFEDIIVEFHPSHSEMFAHKKDNLGILKIIVKEHPFINRIKIKGNEYIEESILLKALPFKEGDIMRVDKLKTAEMVLKDLYKRKGFLETEIKIDVLEIMKPRQYDIVITIKEGKPLRIKEIVITGYDPWIKAEMETEIGDIYDIEKLNEDMERLRDYLYKKGYYNPSITLKGFIDRRLLIQVRPGKRLSLHFSGGSEFSEEELKKIISLKGTEINSDTIAEASERIVRAYHKKGYPYALVSHELKEGEEKIDLHFYINEGKKYFVREIKIKGTTIPEERIKAVMAIKEKAPFNPDLLDDDAEAIEAFYRALGYLEFEIKDMKYIVKNDSIELYIEISEGTQSRIKKIEIYGNSILSSQEILQTLSVKENSVYNELVLFDIKREITNIYLERGYLDTEVNLSVETYKGDVKIKVEIREGYPYYFGKTIIRGNKTTSMVVIQRELNYNEGDPLNTKLLPQLSKKLYQLGLFRDVKISILNPYRPVTPSTTGVPAENKRDILIEVTERKQGVFEFGFGYGEYEGLRGFLDIKYNNLWGMNRSAGLRFEMSSLKRRLLLTYNEPYLLNRKLKLSSVAQYSERKEKNVDTGDIRYRIRRYSVNISIEKRLTDHIRLNTTYGYALVKTFDVEPGIVLSREDTGTLAISSLMQGIVYDSRDNPFNPKRGIFAGASLKFASQLLLGETDFLKFSYYLSTYREIMRRLVLAISLRGGVAESFRATRNLPLVERYFLGGRNSVRGFPQDELGPKGPDGTPTGGNIYIASNIEFRTYLGKGFSVVTFFDTGNVWQNLRTINSSLRFTAGIGFRYNTPVGPIRVDYGHKLDRREGESAGEIHFSIGHAF